ncbi:hypothetical protein PAHAL_1G175000 [Panicum hallii]|uniref:Myb/SANT-like domain-containing protein n=1 Tax=Panicum hallii TaxID=206008 RepID=A0A2T8KVL1_9POAL|nr:hypothetical protein PAHAL_1G175000 [Panicum hallii]
MTNAIGYVLGNAAISGDVSRAAWNSAYEKGLVEILHVYKDNPKYKGQIGWVSEGRRIITTKFNERFPVAHFTKQQIQEKEKELIANYKALKGAKGESGNGWNESLCMILAEPKIWEKLIKNHPKVAKFRKKPFPLFYQLDPLVVAPVVSPTVVPTVAPAERSISEQSLHNDLRNFGNNPFASSFDGQETSSACNEQNEAQSAPSEGGSGRKRKQSHIGSALEDFVEFKKSQTSKTLEALNEKKKREEEFSIEKCADQVDSMNELTNEEKSYAMELFESDRNREVYMKTKNCDVRLIWLKRKIRYVSLNMLSVLS